MPAQILLPNVHFHVSTQLQASIKKPAISGIIDNKKHIKQQKNKRDVISNLSNDTRLELHRRYTIKVNSKNI